MTFVRVWQFRPAPGAEREFADVYGPDGDWARLFRHGAGFIGTELRAADKPGEFQTIDRWESRAAWDTFRREHHDEYVALDRRCERLTSAEIAVSEQDIEEK